MSTFDALNRRDDSRQILDANNTSLAEIEARNQESAHRARLRSLEKEARAHQVVVAPAKPQPPLDALQVREPGSNRIIDLPGPRISNIYTVITRTLDDGGFSPRSNEVKAMLAALEEDAKLCSEIAAFGESELRRKRKEEALTAKKPLPHVDIQVAEAKQYIKTLKLRRATLRKSVATIVEGMMERALLACDVVISIITENERSRAEDFGVEFAASNTLKAVTVAKRMLVDAARVVGQSPDLVDVTQVCRLLGIQHDFAKSGTKQLGYIEV